MNQFIKHSIRFVLFILAQSLIFNQMEVGFGIQIMIYPLFVFLLPVEMGVFSLMSLSFILGLAIDAMSNTYGLHASSLLFVAYLRPVFFKIFAPRDGYDPNTETNIHMMGTSWYVKSFGILMLIHHFWFFLIEIFKLNDLIYILQKTLISVVLSFIICTLIQYLFLKKPKEK